MANRQTHKKQGDIAGPPPRNEKSEHCALITKFYTVIMEQNLIGNGLPDKKNFDIFRHCALAKFKSNETGVSDSPSPWVRGTPWVRLRRGVFWYGVSVRWFGAMFFGTVIWCD